MVSPPSRRWQDVLDLLDAGINVISAVNIQPIVLIEYLCLADSKLKALTAHVFNQNRQVKLTAARHLEAVRGICLLHPQAHVRVQLPEQAVTQMAGGDIFAFVWNLPADKPHQLNEL